MVSINKTSNQPYSPNNQKTHSGLKLGSGIAALAGVSLLSYPKLLDWNAYNSAVAARKKILENRKTINDLSKNATELTEATVMYDILYAKDHTPPNGTETFAQKAANYINEGEKEKINSNAKEMLGKAAEAIEAKSEEIKKSYEDARKLFDERRALKKINVKKMSAILVPFVVASGAVVDYMNNRQRAKTEPNAKTKNGNDYVKTNMGKKLGGFLGLVSEGGIIALNRTLKTGEHYSSPLLSIATAAAGGFILGAIADKMSNRKAAKAADKNA